MYYYFALSPIEILVCFFTCELVFNVSFSLNVFICTVNPCQSSTSRVRERHQEFLSVVVIIMEYLLYLHVYYILNQMNPDVTMNPYLLFILVSFTILYFPSLCVFPLWGFGKGVPPPLPRDWDKDCMCWLFPTFLIYWLFFLMRCWVNLS